MAKCVLDKIENIVGKEENAGYQHFLLFPQCFQKDFSLRLSKVVIAWLKELKPIKTKPSSLLEINSTVNKYDHSLYGCTSDRKQPVTKEFMS